MAAMSASASVAAPDDGAGGSSDDLRRDLRRFLLGATHQSRLSQTELTAAALRLLGSLPAARHAGLEWLCSVFDSSMMQFVGKLESGENAETAAAACEQDLLTEIGDTIIGLLNASPASWVPLIASWSLSLLGRLSARYAPRAQAPHSSGLNDTVQLWLSCPATRQLINICVQCVTYDTDACIKPLLDTSAAYTPHFDWVVAHIGSCFPSKIIERVLHVGLQEFCNLHTGESANEDSVKPNSVVQILGHLAARNSAEIGDALKTLLCHSLATGVVKTEGNREEVECRLATVPFLLHLASLSSVLLTTLSTEILSTVTVQQLGLMAAQSVHWIPRYFSTQEALLALIVHLVLRCERGALPVLQLMFKAADVDSKEVGRAAHQLIHRVLTELQRLVYGCQPGAVPDLPLMATLPDTLPHLIHHLTEDSDRARACVQLLATAATCRGPSAAAHTLSRLLERPQLQLSTVLRLLRALESNFPDVFVEALRHATAESAAPEQVLRSVVRLLRWERRVQTTTACRVQTRLSLAVSQCVPLLAEGLAELRTADAAMEALASLELPQSLAGSRQLSLAHSVVGYLFYCVRRREQPAQTVRRTRLAQQVLCRLSGQPVCLPAVLRSLLDAALQPYQAAYLGASSDAPRVSKSAQPLLEENRRHASIVTVPQAHTTVFHAGVIGEGRRAEPAPPAMDAAGSRLNCELVLETIGLCVEAARCPDDGARTLALLMVEFISPDVMFNGLPWPDEEFMKVTMERDLRVRRFFDSHPLSWCLLELVARRPPAICYCSVLLRAIAATLIQHWSTTQEPMARDSARALEMTERLLRVMSLGRLLPAPLTLIPEMLPSISSYEVWLLLTDVWAYMRETVPSPAAFTQEAGVATRMFPPLDPRYSQRLLLVLQNNVAELGHLLAQVQQATPCPPPQAVPTNGVQQQPAPPPPGATPQSALLVD